jgi:hypothetical protein
VTVLELSPKPRVADDDYVSMSGAVADMLDPISELRRRYLEALLERSRRRPPPLALPFRPVVGRGQFEVVPEDVRALLPPYSRPRRRRYQD